MIEPILKLDPAIQHVLWWDGQVYRGVALAEVARLREALETLAAHTKWCVIQQYGDMECPLAGEVRAALAGEAKPEQEGGK